METAEKILRLYREQYFDFNMGRFHQEIKEEHSISVSYSWTRGLLQRSGLVLKSKKRGQYRRKSQRRPLPGMLLHLEGSDHRWFDHPLDERQTLLSVLDDATSERPGAVFVPQEATRPILGLPSQIVRKHDAFISLYTDRAGHFVHTSKVGGPPDRSQKTQIEMVPDQLGLESIAVNSPEARGRFERGFGTMQGRLVPELRRAGVSTYEDANRYLQRVFIPKFNRYFGVGTTESGTAFLPVIGADLNRIFAIAYERALNKDNTVQFEGRVFQLPKVKGVSTLARRKVEIREHLDGILEVLHGKTVAARFNRNSGMEADGEGMASFNLRLRNGSKNKNRTFHSSMEPDILKS